MNNSLLVEVFARILFSFTHGVTEHYDPDEPEAETFGYNDSLSGEGREWNCYPVDKPICQEYSPPSDDYYDLLSVGNPRARYRVIGASSPDEDGDDRQNEDDDMAWKRFRPSVLCTVCLSMYIGALISLLTPAIISLFYVTMAYVSYETTRNCQFHPAETILVKIQWIRTLSDVIGVAFLYITYFPSSPLSIYPSSQYPFAWFFCCYLPARLFRNFTFNYRKKAKKKSRKRSNIVQFGRWRDSFGSALCSILS